MTAALLLGLTANGQNYFFIGERSFPCTESFILKSNSKKPYVNDLIVRFGKDGAKGIILVSIKTVSTVRISGKLNNYLDNGTVIY